MQLDDWQKEILEHVGNLLLCTGRQNGKTTILSRKICKYLLENAGSRIIVASLTEDQAKLIIVMVLDYLEKNHKNEIAKGKAKPTQNKVTLKNKSSVIARPVGNTGDAIRGFTADVLVLDEVSRFNELILESAKPTLFSTGGEIWMASTPYGKKGYFYEMFHEWELDPEKAHFKVWHVNSEQVAHNRVICDTWTEQRRAEALAFLEQEKKSKSRTYYGQEYLAMFLDDLLQFFPDELISERLNLKRGERNESGYFVMGCDLARFGGDASTFEIFEVRENKRIRQVESIVKFGLSTTENERLIIELTKMWNISKVGIDAGAGTLGVAIYDHLLENPYMKRKIVAMNNRQLVMDRDGTKKQRMMKEDYYDNAKAMMERQEVLFLDDEEIRLSLKSVQLAIEEEADKMTQVRIFSSPHSQSHIIEGIVRALFLAKERKTLNFHIYSI